MGFEEYDGDLDFEEQESDIEDTIPEEQIDEPPLTDADAPPDMSVIGHGTRLLVDDDSQRIWECGCYEDQGGYHFCAQRVL